jgi:hypothetical protein
VHREAFSTACKLQAHVPVLGTAFSFIVSLEDDQVNCGGIIIARNQSESFFNAAPARQAMESRSHETQPLRSISRRGKIHNQG